MDLNSLLSWIKEKKEEVILSVSQENEFENPSIEIYDDYRE